MGLRFDLAKTPVQVRANPFDERIDRDYACFSSKSQIRVALSVTLVLVGSLVFIGWSIPSGLSQCLYRYWRRPEPVPNH